MSAKSVQVRTVSSLLHPGNRAGNTAVNSSWRSRTKILLSLVILIVFLSGIAVAQTSININFESPLYLTGTVHNQNGWSSSGTATGSCATYDHYVVNNGILGAPASFGGQSLRISNAVTSGCFGDNTFSKSLFNEAGETGAQSSPFSGGVRLNHYEAEFNIASTVPAAQQPGLAMSVAPDRGDGARMSYLRFEDQADGIHIFFDEYKDVAPFGGAIGDAAGCSGSDNFTDDDIATINRAAPHTIKFVMDFVDGPRNDVVKIYIDNALVKTGTSWEDYSRYCAGSAPATVDSLLFRTGGTAVPANAGKGYLFDNMTLSSSGPLTTVTVGAASLTATPNLTNWFFYNDETDVIDNSLGSFVAGPGTPPLGNGSVQMSVSGTQRRNIATYQFSGTPLANIAELKFSTYNPSAGNGGSPNRSGYLNFNVDFNGSDTFQRRLSYVPSANGAVIQNQWQEWDAINGGSAKWFYSGAVWPGTATPGLTARTWSDILASYPGVRIRVTDAFLGIRAGEPYADGYTEDIDAFKFGTAAGTKQFNFEPQASTVYVDDNWTGTTPGTDPDGAGPATSYGYDAFDNVKSGADAVAAGGTVNVYSGTYTLTSTVNMNKTGVTVVGLGTKPVVQAASAIGNAFFVTAPGVTLNNLEIKKTDLPDQQLIAVQADNFTASNNLIYGPNPGTDWSSAGIVSRAFVISANNNINIQNNVIHTLRQPAYISGGDTTGGTISGNNVSGTKGWVVEGGNFAFSGNTFGEPQNQSCDIALLANLSPVNIAFYQTLLNLSMNNDNAFICAQYAGGENGRAVAYVNDGASPGGNGSDNTNYQSINTAVAGTLAGGTVQVAGGTYNEDVTVGKTVRIVGAGSASTTVVGPIGGSGSTFQIAANNVELSGFKITRAGNNPTDWNDPNLNVIGVGIQGTNVTNANVHDNLITGNRNGIDINNSNGHSFHNNVIDSNRTGMILRNQTDNLTFVENSITNNFTLGIVLLDGSGGTNVPVQSALNCSFFNNNLSGNWYGQIVDRQSGGSLPVPGTNLKNFSGNWFGSASPVVTTANSVEPGYAAQIPVAFGGSAVAPGGQPDIAGPASANFDYTPNLNAGTDSNVETTPGRGTFGFQGSFNALSVSASSAQTGATSKIQEAINLITPGGSLAVPGGAYPGNVNVNKALTISGAFTVGGSFTTSAAGVTVNPGNSPGIINSGNLSLGSGTTVNMELNGTVAGTNYDQFNVTGTVNIASNVTLNTTVGYVPGAGHSYTIINNDGGDPVTGTFNGLPDDSIFYVGANSFRIDYNGGDGNDVVITAVNLCNTVSIPTNITTLTGNPVVAPVSVDDTTGNGLISSDFTVNYNPSVVTFNSVSLGTVTAGSSLAVNSSTPGTLVVSIFRATPFSGSGTLANITFNAVGSPGSSSPVSFSAFKFNEGTPCLTLNNGLITILSGTISGRVTYGNPVVGPNPRGIPGVNLSAVGSVNVSTVSQSIVPVGNYTLSGMGAGPYTVTPSKSGGDNGAVSGFDAAKIAQFVVGNATLNSTQQTVADVSGTGGITSFDAALIARYTVLLPGSGSSGTWRFAPASRSYPNVNTNISNEDYSALLMGDVTGNWNDPTPEPGGRSSLKPVDVTAGTAQVTPKSAITIPVSLAGDMTGRGVVSYQFKLTYNPKVVEPQAVPVEIADTMSSRLFVTANTETVGVIRVVVFGAAPLESKGLLLNLKFTALGETGSSSPLAFQNFMFNEGEIRSTTIDGNVQITAQPEDEASIEGKLITADGIGLPNTRVTLTNSNTGETYTVLSNGFGIYRFGGVKSGSTYLISIESRQFMFAPQAITVLGDMTDVNLRATP